jgi:hypothetical protein
LPGSRNTGRPPAHRRAARYQDDVGRRSLQGGANGLTPVRHERGDGWQSAVPAGQGLQHDRVAIDDLVAFRPRPAGQQLVPGDEDGDPRPADDPHRRRPDRGEDGDVLRPQHAAGAEQDSAGLDVLAALADVPPRRQGVADAQPGAAQRGDLLSRLRLEDGVRPRRQRRAGHDANGLPRPDPARERSAREGLPNDIEL